MQPSDFLKNLESVVEANLVDIYVPSRKLVFNFKPLNLAQQKTLFKSSLDESFTKLQFNSSFYEILRANAPRDLDIKELYTYDRTAIAVAYKANSIREKYFYQDKEVDLSALVKTFESIDNKSVTLSKVVEDSSILVNLAVPTLAIDHDVNGYAQLKIKNNKELQNVITELYVFEVSKYITDILIKKNDEKIIFTNISVSDRVKATELLPSSITSEILNFIKPIRDFENKYITVDKDTVLEIDGSFFGV